MGEFHLITMGGVSPDYGEPENRRGVGRSGNIHIPYALTPKRTFAEVEQPESQFIFRVHQAQEVQLPRPALYETDNGLEAPGDGVDQRRTG